MTYGWGCGACAVQSDKGRLYQIKVEVTRKMDDYKVPPWHECPGCQQTDWVKLVDLPSRPQNLTNQPWPLRLNHIENVIPVRDHTGKIIGQQRERIVAESKRHYDEIIKQRDLVMYADGEDSSVNIDSQHSAWGQQESAPPSSHAQALLDDAHFVGADELGAYNFEERPQPGV